MTRFALGMLLIIVSLSVSIQASTFSGTVYGGSLPLENATVYLKDSSNGSFLDSTVTNASGYYSFVVSDATYNLLVSPPEGSEFLDAQVNNIVVAGDKVQNVVLVPEAVTLTCTVQNPHGVKFHDVKVVVRDADTLAELDNELSDANGLVSFNLEPKPYFIDILGPNYGLSPIGPDYPTVMHIQNFTKLDLVEDTSTTLEIPLKYIGATVRDSTGNIMPDYQVGIYIDTLESMGSYDRDYGYAFTEKTDSNGFINIPVLAGQWDVHVSAAQGWGDARVLQDVNLIVDETRDLILPPDLTISGIFQQANGTPMANADISANHRTLHTVGFDRIEPADNGMYSMVVSKDVSLSGLGFRYYSNFEISDLIAFRIFNVLQNTIITTSTELNVVVDTVSYSGQILDDGGQPLPHVRIDVEGGHTSADPPFYDYFIQDYFESDDFGNYHFSIPQGKYRMQITPPQGSHLANLTFDETFSTDTVKNIQFPATYLVRGTVYVPGDRPLRNTQIGFLQNGIEAQEAALTDENGTFEFYVAAGNYSHSVICYDFDIPELPLPASILIHQRGDPIHVTTDTTIEFRLPLTQLQGKTTDRNGVPVAGVEFSVPTYGNDLVRNISYSWQQSNDEASRPDGTYELLFYSASQDLTIKPPSQSGFANINLPAYEFPEYQFINQNVVLNFIDTTPPAIVAGPLVDRITDQSGVVSFQTDEISSGTVLIGDGTSTQTLPFADFAVLHEVRLTSLTASTHYSVYVQAFDAGANGPTLAGPVAFHTLPTPDLTPPSILEGPVVVDVADKAATIYWLTDEPADGQVAYGQTSDTLSQHQGDLDFSTEHQIELTSLTPSTLYFLSVASADPSGNGPTSSSIISFYTLASADITSATIIEGPLAINITDSEATIIWTTDEPASSGVSYNDGITYGVVSDPELVTHHSVNLTGLDAATLFHYTISSIDGAGNGPTLSEQGQFTTADEQDQHPPVIVPGSVIINIAQQSAVVRWETDEPSTSIIEYGTSATLGTVESSTQLVREHNVPITGLQAATLYYFRVKSVDSTGNEAVGGAISFTTEALQDDDPPIVLNGPRLIGRTDHSATIYWETDEPSDSVVNYGDAGTLNRRDSDPQKVTAHTVILSGLESGSTYYISISSTDHSGNTYSGAEVALDAVPTLKRTGQKLVNPDTIAPQITSGPSVVALSSDRALIQWKTNEIANTQLAYAKNPQPLTGFNGDIAQVTEHSILLTNLQPSTVYRFQAESRDQSGNATTSTLRNFTTHALPDMQSPALTSGPVKSISTIAPGAVRFTWQTNEYTNGQVLYGTDPAHLDKMADDNAGFAPIHSITLTNLVPGETYHYRLASFDISGNALLSAAGFDAVPNWSLYE